MLVATDKAGNTREMPLVYELKNVKYRKSTHRHSDSFLQNKVAPLLTDVAARQGAPKDVFVAVNKKLRKENDDKITEITQQGHALDAVERRLRAAQQLEGRSELRRPAHLHLQRRGDRHRVPPRLRPLRDEALSGRGRQQRHRGLRRRPGHLRQHRDPRPRPRALHALRAPELDRREGRRRPSPSGRSSARRARPGSPPAITCTTASTWTASRCCRSSGGIRSGSTTTSRRSWTGRAGRRSPRHSRRRRQSRGAPRESGGGNAPAARRLLLSSRAQRGISASRRPRSFACGSG